MTEAEHAALSADLARALGWGIVHLSNSGNTAHVSHYADESLRHFDYRAPDVCLPLIEWIGKEYRVFFWWCRDDKWASSRGGNSWPTLPQIVARAVIALRKT